ncbi:membrane protein [Tistlia consotensis]|uniref:UPF0761 membrane protein SAMN05428998_12392 n=1 Tax=Tistlia consotensis USBA 355 TaxID=560819 RepID=A0A1Y6CFN0_9PROT|nr:YihY family inner membrane protein [Tistlia consotensis]SMF60778.1 tRNA-processing RNAse BN [Tistlia consotensis USBA 355]SNR92746.1 membrane protein [Tistlia consotensis]
MTEGKALASRLSAVWKRSGGFASFLGRRCLRDNLTGLAASLSYTSLLALVPMLAIALSVLAAFPAFDQARERLRGAIFDILPADQAAAAAAQIQSFLDNATNMTAAGVIGLAVTALLLLSAINGALNTVWRITQQRPLASRFLVYWALLTMGPLLIGASLTVSSYAFALAQSATVQVIGSDFVAFSRLISILLAAVGFVLVYFIVPNRTVALRDALVGGFAAAVALEGLKALFGLYIANFSSYALIYGALAAIPIFLLWMYAFWVIVLLGAEITAMLPEWRVTARRDGGSERAATRLVLALAILCRLGEAHRDGSTVRHGRLLRSLPVTPAELDECLSRLRRAHLIQRSDSDRLLLARDLAKVDLDSLLEVLGLRLRASVAWPEASRRVIEAMDGALGRYRSASLASLLDDPDLMESTARLRPAGKAAPVRLDAEEEAGAAD